MAILEILHYPDPRLRNRAETVQNVDGEIRRLVDDMFETMYDAPGIGLAAIQVNVPRRVLVIDVSEERNEPLCFINPEILEKHGEETMEEGCLSVPGYYDKVTRAERIRVRALDRDGVGQQLRPDPQRKPTEIGCVFAGVNLRVGELSPDAYAALLEEL